ncbi:hypothetical protein G6038_15490 [Rhodococcus sp. 14C212]|uniref:hypothetical protein n=1 Tax=Rhodococcus sp. 14C212 TaxID=2711209 RepID=UPI0013E9C70A|nr:hypothetical protein [Rhodococcus sp. 14C212]NGP06858.1 hypothetical protein [Rhodococcus sp. 14C212]
MSEPVPLLRPAVLAAGITDAELRRGIRTGDLERIVPGVYVDREGAGQLDDVGRHLLRIRLTAARLREGAAISHVSAAVVHGFDIWRTDLSRIHLTRDRASGGRRSPRQHIHAASLETDEVDLVDGFRVTSAARTIADLARTVTAEEAVVTGDSALRGRPSLRPALAAALQRAGARTGIAAARRIVPFLDGRSESPGESISRLRIHQAGLPAPALQHEVRTSDGRFVARTDFFWEDFGIVGEFDGMGKYGAGDPGTTAETVRREKLREDALRDLGFEVVRWTWADLFRFPTVIARYERAVARSRR